MTDPIYQKAKRIKAPDLGERVVRFVASTPREDRDGDVIEPAGIKTGEFEANPVALWAHDNSQPPVGRVVNWEKRGDEFIVDIRFDKDDFSEMIYRKVQSGSLNAVSIGFMPIDDQVERREEGGYRFRAVELLEVSVVPVPSNRDAVVAMRDAWLGDYEKQLEAWADKLPEPLKAGQVLSASNRDEVIEAMQALARVLMADGTDPMEAMAELDGYDADKSVEKMLEAGDREAVVGLLEGKGARLERLQSVMEADELTEVDYRRFAKLLERDKRDNRILYKIMVDPHDAPDEVRPMRDSPDEGDDGGGADEGDAPAKDIQTKAVVDFQDLPLGARDAEWDSDAALGRWREASGSTEEPSDDYRQAFVWYDDEDAENFGAYKLPIADVVDGTLTAMPRGIFAAAMAIEGARGGVDIPDDDMAGVREHLESYYAKMRTAFEDDAIQAPWTTDESADTHIERMTESAPADSPTGDAPDPPAETWCVVEDIDW